MLEKFIADIYDFIKTIPEGKVATYGQIAMMLDHPRCARMVGHALHTAPPGSEIPCHRVVNRDGRTAIGFTIQRELLLQEGVTFLENGCVDLSKHLFKPSGTIS